MPKSERRKEEQRTMLTFAQAAARLVDDGHVRSMGPEGLRKLARTDPEWLLTEDDYGTVAGARTVPYERVVEYIQTRSKRPGRGPAKPPAAE
ncbi:hypothetical protein ACWCQM_06985 [Streptomyces sp. NPDC002125]